MEEGCESPYNSSDCVGADNKKVCLTVHTQDRCVPLELVVLQTDSLVVVTRIMSVNKYYRCFVLRNNRARKLSIRNRLSCIEEYKRTLMSGFITGGFYINSGIFLKCDTDEPSERGVSVFINPLENGAMFPDYGRIASGFKYPEDWVEYETIRRKKECYTNSLCVLKFQLSNPVLDLVMDCEKKESSCIFQERWELSSFVRIQSFCFGVSSVTRKVSSNDDMVEEAYFSISFRLLIISVDERHDRFEGLSSGFASLKNLGRFVAPLSRGSPTLTIFTDGNSINDRLFKVDVGSVVENSESDWLVAWLSKIQAALQSSGMWLPCERWVYDPKSCFNVGTGLTKIMDEEVSGRLSHSISIGDFNIGSEDGLIEFREWIVRRDGKSAARLQEWNEHEPVIDEDNDCEDDALFRWSEPSVCCQGSRITPLWSLL